MKRWHVGCWTRDGKPNIPTSQTSEAFSRLELRRPHLFPLVIYPWFSFVDEPADFGQPLSSPIFQPRDTPIDPLSRIQTIRCLSFIVMQLNILSTFP